MYTEVKISKKEVISVVVGITVAMTFLAWAFDRALTISGF